MLYAEEAAIRASLQPAACVRTRRETRPPSRVLKKSVLDFFFLHRPQRMSGGRRAAGSAGRRALHGSRRVCVNTLRAYWTVNSFVPAGCPSNVISTEYFPFGHPSGFEM